jgi:hypothetical protein
MPAIAVVARVMGRDMEVFMMFRRARSPDFLSGEEELG